MMESQEISSKRNWIPWLAGSLIFLCICGAVGVWLLWTGNFRLFIRPLQGLVPNPALSSPLPTAIPTLTDKDFSGLTYDQRMNLAAPYITEASRHAQNQSYNEAIASWDTVIEIVPEYADAYNNRGQAYLKLISNQHSQETFSDLLALAGDDFNQAIELAPYENGDYYMGRYKYYDYLSALQSSRVDYMATIQIASDNLLLANQLGNTDPLAQRYVIYSNVVLGNCDEAIAQASELADMSPEIANYHMGLALGYSCKNEPQAALQQIDEAIRLKDTCLNRFERAKILYALGRNQDAMADLDYSISKDPYYCGNRYYLRGLLHIEAGDIAKAEKDLAFGMGQTWDRGGFLEYAQGKIALAQGDTSAAIQHFQEAEMTYLLLDPILLKIQSDLDRLGVAPIEQFFSVPLATAIPTITPQP